MIEADVFEERLADALQAYAAEAPLEVDAPTLAMAIAARAPRRTGLSMLFGSPRRRQLVLLMVGALLILATLLTIAAVGAWLRRDDRLVVDPDHPVPDELYGEWRPIPVTGSTTPSSTYHLDFTGQALIVGTDGNDYAWVGRSVAFFTTSPRVWDMVVRSSGRCGEGRYVLREVAIRGPDLPVETLRFTDAQDACTERIAILQGAFAWGRHDPDALVLIPGRTYDSAPFTEPFHFVMPTTDPVGSMQRWGSEGRLQIGAGCCWSSWFIDDLPVSVDLCDSTKGRLDDVPATPEAVRDWLRSSSGLGVSEPIEVPVDGRIALRFDLPPTEGCHGGALTPPNVMAGFRIYAIPTGDDTILVSAWSDPGSLPSVDKGIEELVRSMTFD